MTGFKPGTRVHIEFDGKVEEPTTARAVLKHPEATLAEGRGWGFVQIRDSKTGLYHLIWQHVSDSPRFPSPISKTEPEGWPVETGDVWEAAGKEYVAVKGYGGDGPTLLEVDGCRSCELRKFKALDPILIRRR